MLEKKVVSQCISSDYCRGWNDAVDAMPKWNDAKKFLPGEMIDGDVLVIVNGRHGNTVFEDAYMLAEYVSGLGWIIEGYEEWEKPHVTHWMPLPESPKEEEKC